MTGFTVAGIPLEVGPEHLVSDVEREILEMVADRKRTTSSPAVIPFCLRLENRRCSKPADSLKSDGGPATLTSDGGLIRLSHTAFTAEIDPLRGCGLLRRDPRDEFPLRVTLRVAMCGRLPLVGAVPLHAAGVVMEGSGVVFFGPSGAGKSTLSATSPYPVLSDELVIAGTRPPTVASAGFLVSGSSALGRHDLRALVELDKGSEFAMIELGSKEAFRRLLMVTMVPDSSALWARSMAVLTKLIHEVPVYRMAWSPADPPWERIASLVEFGREDSVIA